MHDLDDLELLHKGLSQTLYADNQYMLAVPRGNVKLVLHLFFAIFIRLSFQHIVLLFKFMAEKGIS